MGDRNEGEAKAFPSNVHPKNKTKVFWFQNLAKQQLPTQHEHLVKGQAQKFNYCSGDPIFIFSSSNLPQQLQICETQFYISLLNRGG